MTASPSSTRWPAGQYAELDPAADLRGNYRRVFIADSRDWFVGVHDLFDPALDLVLTYDFALRREIEQAGGDARYVDQLVDPATMQENNFLIYRFFADWHRDAGGADLFTYDGVPFGFSFRLEFWNDYVSYVRTHLCLQRLASLRFDELYAGTDLGLVERVLGELGRPYARLVPPRGASRPQFYFPIHRWMQANIRRRGFKATALSLVGWTLGTTLEWTDRVRRIGARRPAVFVQEYHPTEAIIRRLRTDGRVRVVGAAPSRTHFFGRFIPLPTRRRRHERAASALLRDFRARRASHLILGTGTDVTEGAYAIIEERVAPRVAESIRTLEGAIHYLQRSPLALELLIANIGDVVTLVDCVCRAHGIPSYLIINGLLAVAYADDSKYATVINAYSASIKAHYFRGMDNLVCLGDPRMDRYPPVPRRALKPGIFTVTVGASGFNPTDLNSYVAVEFDFMREVLEAVRRVAAEGTIARVIVKVRPNGYRQQYEQFVAEYFPELGAQVLDQTSMREVLGDTDVFVSIYSQTLFEASCMGIPVVYHRVGDFYKDPPFDGHSELVTTGSIDDLAQALRDYADGHDRFLPFLDRKVMERYVGPLDGHNVDRNVAFIYELLALSPAAQGT